MDFLLQSLSGQKLNKFFVSRATGCYVNFMRMGKYESVSSLQAA